MADAVRVATEQSTAMAGGAPAALVAIVAEPGLSIENLRRVLALTHPGTVRLVDRLVDNGWVRREQGAGRALRLQPTNAGRAAERRLAAAREAALTQLLAALPIQDVHQIAALVDPLLGSMAPSVEHTRRTCRLCDRAVCEPCPAEGQRPPQPATDDRGADLPS